MRNFLLIISFLYISHFSRSQSISTSLIGTAGASGSFAGIEMDWSIGEAVTEVFDAQSLILILNQGFHQPYSAGWIPDDRIISGILASGEDTCYDALLTIQVVDFIAMNGSSSKLIAGQSVRFLPSTTIHTGSFLHAYISENGIFCNPGFSLLNAQVSDDKEPEVYLNKPDLQGIVTKIYPNPGRSIITVDISGIYSSNHIEFELYNIFGHAVIQQAAESNLTKMDISFLPQGMYLLKIINTDSGDVWVHKIIKN